MQNMDTQTRYEQLEDIYCQYQRQSVYRLLTHQCVLPFYRFISCVKSRVSAIALLGVESQGHHLCVMVPVSDFDTNPTFLDMPPK